MSSSDEHGKIGAGHAAAMGRQGLRELRAALYPNSNVAQQPEYGVYGTKTPGEVAEDRRDANEKDVQGHSIVEDRLRQAERDSTEKAEGDRGLDREE